MTTDERIKKIFDTIGVDLTNIKNNTNLLELGILDSLKMVQLINVCSTTELLFKTPVS